MSSNQPELPPLTIGTAGHIDHGKTLIIEKLTGMRADRPYERERGMTIDIGYAEMRAPDGRRIGFVDLPGHERFVRNMVAGATGIDLALLVVAADDGVMPQTREHLEILDLLGVRRGLVVLNKIDLVDDEMRELATEELTDFLEGSALEGAPIFPCSAATGEGVDAVREAILATLHEVAHGDDPGAFYCAVQRSFAAAGFGCIVTGVPAAGRIAVGDDIELLPTAEKGRVRAIEIYHEAAEQARAGHRTALNLAGIHHEQAERGMVVAAPGVYQPTRHVAVALRLLGSARRPLKHASPIRFLTGTLEGMATIYLLEGSALAPGDSALVEIRTKQPIPVRDGAPFILRTDNAKETIGGGRVVASLNKPIGRKSSALHDQLRSWSRVLNDPMARIRFLLEQGGGLTGPVLARRAQLDVEWVKKKLSGMHDAIALPGGAWTTAAAIEHAAAALGESLRTMHNEQPLLASLPIAEVRDRAGLDEARLSAALEKLGDQVVVEARTLRHRDHRVQLDSATEEAAGAVERTLRAAAFAPPARAKLADQAGLSGPDANDALTYLTARGALREVAPGVVYLRATLDEGIRLLAKISEKRGLFEPVEAKAAFGDISRKWLIPLLEYYDKIGATRRDGNARHLTNKGRAMAEGGIDVA
ncbi:MAG: selenocysteine-specific translation elongation factor [Planctomycetota bacterium]|jgi:selenocysteine-specific elongation factor